MPFAGGFVRSLAATHTVCVWLFATDDVEPTPSHPEVLPLLLLLELGVPFDEPHATPSGIKRRVMVAPETNSRRVCMASSSSSSGGSYEGEARRVSEAYVVLFE